MGVCVCVCSPLVSAYATRCKIDVNNTWHKHMCNKTYVQFLHISCTVCDLMQATPLLPCVGNKRISTDPPSCRSHCTLAAIRSVHEDLPGHRQTTSTCRALTSRRL